LLRVEEAWPDSHAGDKQLENGQPCNDRAQGLEWSTTANHAVREPANHSFSVTRVTESTIFQLDPTAGANRRTPRIAATYSDQTRRNLLMVRIDRVVTKGGDTGQTSLGDGSRVSKADPRIEAMGAVDEANASIGVLRIHTRSRPHEDAMLARIQNDLFDVGADLCVPGTGEDRLRVTAAAVDRLEAEVDRMNQALPPLKSFILPGGSDASAFAHIARVTARRAERSVVALDNINPVVQCYLNRLSDHLFVLARLLNENAATDVLWVPGANRS
jgi:cob(I)alamin adenosyltransferase